MPNEKNIRAVIDMIRQEENYFNMNAWINYKTTETVIYPENICGTPSCIGGWAEAIKRYEQNISLVKDVSWQETAAWLGLNSTEAKILFFFYVGDPTREQAIAHLEHIIETGEVDWRRFTNDR